jgi:GNAT superfamily N-acetyltransferase
MEINSLENNIYNDLEYNLSVIPLRLQDRETIAKTAAIWAKTAREKASASWWNSSEQRVFEDCAWICDVFHSKLQGSLGRSKIYICVDQNKTPWGLIEVTENPIRLHVDFLVTHPNNIRARVNEQEIEKVRGAGSLLLQKAEELARNLGKTSIDLTPLTSAIEFYQKNGFAQRNNGTMIKLITKVDDLALPLLAAG